MHAALYNIHNKNIEGKSPPGSTLLPNCKTLRRMLDKAQTFTLTLSAMSELQVGGFLIYTTTLYRICCGATVGDLADDADTCGLSAGLHMLIGFNMGESVLTATHSVNHHQRRRRSRLHSVKLRYDVFIVLGHHHRHRTVSTNTRTSYSCCGNSTHKSSIILQSTLLDRRVKSQL